MDMSGLSCKMALVGWLVGWLGVPFLSFVQMGCKNSPLTTSDDEAFFQSGQVISRQEL